jgi:hypothetical protein
MEEDKLIIERALAIISGVASHDAPLVTTTMYSGNFASSSEHRRFENVSNVATCRHCTGETIPKWRRGGKIVERIWPNSRRELACHYCGRAVNPELTR